MAATAAKLLFGLLVFVATVGTYSYFTEERRARAPLPDDKKSSGACSLWLVGSSSMHRWSSATKDLAGWQVHNRGIEGARLPELQRRLKLTEDDGSPAAIVLYAGENDLADGAEPRDVLHGLQRLARSLGRHAPDATIYLVSMKPSPARWNDRAAQQIVSEGLQRFTARHPKMEYVAASDRLLADGRPGPFYKRDGIHLSEEGYRQWGGEIERHLTVTKNGASRNCGSTSPA